MARRLRRNRYSSWSSCSTMGSLPESTTSTASSSSRRRSRDTGFPEPFCGNRNTTLPHPDADLSPDACISSDDIAVGRVLHRQRRSFMVKHKRTINHGVITPEMQRMNMNSSGLGLGFELYEGDIPSNTAGDGASLASTDESGVVSEGSPLPAPAMSISGNRVNRDSIHDHDHDHDHESQSSPTKTSRARDLLLRPRAGKDSSNSDNIERRKSVFRRLIHR